MVRAILDGQKTMTRRIVHADIVADMGSDASRVLYRCPYGQPGDYLWVRESWAQRLDLDRLNGTQLYASGVRNAWYWADGPGKCCNTGCAGAAGRVRAARFMPRWASRLTLRITDVRVQRLQEISEDDAKAEGAPYYVYGHGPVTKTELRIEPGYWGHGSYRAGFECLWNDLNAKRGYGWDVNPWVWAITFEPIEQNIDRVITE